MKFREIENRILQDGWYQVKQKGSHHQYKHPTKPGKEKSQSQNMEGI